MSDYQRQYELINRLGISKTTLRHWLAYFSEFIPKKKQGDIIVYGPEAIQVLSRIKSLRQELYARPTIKTMLLEEGYHKFDDPAETNSF